MKGNQSILLFIGVVVTANLLQCLCTGLLFDEAYYWVWSQHLAFGYFDHPPMVALFIAAGDAVHHSEAGVRLLSILANAGTLYILYNLVKPKDIKLFLVLLLSITPLIAASFFAVPDIPFLFFTACFWVAYKKYLEDDSLPAALLTAACIACMLYSKYHAVLVVFFVVLSNFDLLKRKSFYLAGTIAALLFMPHVWWQWQNDFPTFRFHLFERVVEIYTPLRILEYIGGQLALAGIPTGALLLYACVKQPGDTKFYRGLKFQLWGTFIFFLISSFKNRAEPNWTIANLIPLTILSYRYLENNNRLSVWLYRALPVSILAIAVIRLHFGTDLSRKYLGLHIQTQYWNDWADTVKQHAGDRTVVFLSSYQMASEYMFYSGKKAFSTSETGLRKSQFNLLNTEEEIQNKQVYLCAYWNFIADRTVEKEHIKTEITEFDGLVVDSFLSWIKVKIEPLKKNVALKSGEDFVLPVKVFSPYTNHPPPNANSRLTYRIYQNQIEVVGDYETGISLASAFANKQMDIKIDMPDKPGRYRVFVSARQDNYPPPKNMVAVEVEVQ